MSKSRGCCPALLMTVASAGILFAAPDLPQRVESRWTPHESPPSIDGDQGEWTDRLTAVDRASISLGLQNDAEFLYVAIVVSEPATRELLTRAGFTLWWDTASRARKTSGLVVPPVVTLVPPAPAEEGTSRRSGGPVRDVDPIAHLEVIGPRAEDRRRLQLAYLRTLGLDAVGRVETSVIVYELKIPLARDGSSPYGLGTAPGDGLALGLETGKVPKYRPPDDRRQGGGFGGLGGFGRRPPAGRGDGGGSESDEFAARPFQLWLDVRLAAAPGLGRGPDPARGGHE